jgi:polygalacturonase
MIINNELTTCWTYCSPRRASFLWGANLTDVVLTGDNGTVDGNGQVWWQHHQSGEEIYTRGHLFELMWSTDIEISHLHLTNSPFWTVHPVYCDGFRAHHLWIINPPHSPNTDGIDPDSTQNVQIHDCYIRTGDDCIAIKSGWDQYGYDYAMPSSNIDIRDCILSSPTSAGVCIGSEMSGGVHSVRLTNLSIWGTGFALRLKTGMGRGGYIKDLILSNSTFTNNNVCFEYNEFYGGHPPGYDPNATPVVSHISVYDTHGSGCHQVADLVGFSFSFQTHSLWAPVCDS